MPNTRSVNKSLTGIPFLFYPLLVLIFLATLMAYQIYQGLKPIVVIVGDSNSDTSAILEVHKWTQQYSIQHAADQHIYNLSIGGHAVQDFNTPDVNQQLLEISKHIYPGQKVILVSLLGTNNAIMTQKIYTPDEYIIHYQGLITQFSDILHPDYIVIGSIPPALRLKVLDQWPVDPRAQNLIPQLNESLKQWVISKQTSDRVARWSFVQLLPEDAYGPQNEKKAQSYLIFDGVHLNEFGQATVYNSVNAALQEVTR